MDNFNGFGWFSLVFLLQIVPPSGSYASRRCDSCCCHAGHGADVPRRSVCAFARYCVHAGADVTNKLQQWMGASSQRSTKDPHMLPRPNGGVLRCLFPPRSPHFLQVQPRFFCLHPELATSPPPPTPAFCFCFHQLSVCP